MTQDFIPRKEAAQVMWLGNFQTNIAIQGPTVGISNKQVTEMVSSCSSVIEAIIKFEEKKTSLNKALRKKNLALYTELKGIRKTAAQIKSSKNYMPSIGESLRIIGSEAGFDAASFKPVIAAGVAGDAVRIKFEKDGVDGVNIYHRQKGEVTWNFLARDTKSPYMDLIVLAKPGTPEHWEYRAYGVIDDYQIGLPSTIVEVVVGG